MQFNSDSETTLQSEINITPLVDVVLVLLIIFMVVVPLLLKGYDVSIPRASANTVPTEADASQVVLSIRPTACQIFTPPVGEGLPANCRVSLDEREIPERVGATYKIVQIVDRDLLVRADRDHVLREHVERIPRNHGLLDLAGSHASGDDSRLE